ncbi:hypothetical protein L0Z13_11330 [Burkholderia multivorans]|nr:hypothetical protein [Burkholderia multivorans]UQO04942.1 hypothetical protein L0Z13_11330 [Burkholderia multivorans]
MKTISIQAAQETDVALLMVPERATIAEIIEMKAFYRAEIRRIGEAKK